MRLRCPRRTRCRRPPAARSRRAARPREAPPKDALQVAAVQGPLLRPYRVRFPGRRAPSRESSAVLPPRPRFFEVLHEPDLDVPRRVPPARAPRPSEPRAILPVIWPVGNLRGAPGTSKDGWPNDGSAHASCARRARRRLSASVVRRSRRCAQRPYAAAAECVRR